MENYHRFYDFKIGSQNAGFVEILFNDRDLHLKICFSDKGQIKEHPVHMKFEGSRLVSFQTRQGNWIEIPESEVIRLPTSAIPHYLHLVEDSFEYIAMDDETGHELGLTKLMRAGDWIFESRGYEGLRKFRMEGPVPAEIFWEASSSKLQPTAEAAAKGSLLESK